VGLTTQTTCPASRVNKAFQVRQLALQYPKSSLNNGPLLLYLTARSKERGEEALEKIREDDQLKRASALQQYGGPTEVRYHQLDISQTNSIRMFSDFLKKEHPEGIDIVINNAGIAMDGFSQSSLHLNHVPQ
jgi:carbonyl reductase 1